LKNIIKNLDKAFESKIRLGVMSVLVVNAKLSFNDLKSTLELTDGNLASHLKMLESSGYILVHKSFSGRKPNTMYEITAEGKIAFEKHLKALEEIIKMQ
jgi:DNA-binding HxlR family transcriptional regulator